MIRVRGQKQEYNKETVAVKQVNGNGGWGQAGAEKGRDSGCIRKVEPKGFVDGLEVDERETGEPR